MDKKPRIYPRLCIQKERARKKPRQSSNPTAGYSLQEKFRKLLHRGQSCSSEEAVAGNGGWYEALASVARPHPEPAGLARALGPEQHHDLALRHGQALLLLGPGLVVLAHQQQRLPSACSTATGSGCYGSTATGRPRPGPLQVEPVDAGALARRLHGRGRSWPGAARLLQLMVAVGDGGGVGVGGRGGGGVAAALGARVPQFLRVRQVACADENGWHKVFWLYKYGWVTGCGYNAALWKKRA